LVLIIRVKEKISLFNLKKQILLKVTQPVENSREFMYIENAHGNLNYSLWTFEAPNQRPIRLIIRSSVDGYINTESSSGIVIIT
jgi:hypothetical protein